MCMLFWCDFRVVRGGARYDARAVNAQPLESSAWRLWADLEEGAGNAQANGDVPVEHVETLILLWELPKSLIPGAAHALAAVPHVATLLRPPNPQPNVQGLARP